MINYYEAAVISCRHSGVEERGILYQFADFTSSLWANRVWLPQCKRIDIQHKLICTQQRTSEQLANNILKKTDCAI